LSRTDDAGAGPVYLVFYVGDLKSHEQAMTSLIMLKYLAEEWDERGRPRAIRHVGGSEELDKQGLLVPQARAEEVPGLGVKARGGRQGMAGSDGWRLAGCAVAGGATHWFAFLPERRARGSGEGTCVAHNPHHGSKGGGADRVG